MIQIRIPRAKRWDSHFAPCSRSLNGLIRNPKPCRSGWLRDVDVRVGCGLDYVSRSPRLCWSGYRASVGTPIDPALLYPEMAATLVPLMHGRLHSGPTPEIPDHVPTRSAARVQRQADGLAAPPRAGQACPLLDLPVADDEQITRWDLYAGGKVRRVLGE